MTNRKLADARFGDDRRVDAQVIDEYAETQVLVDKPSQLSVRDDDASAHSVYSEYVQEIERMLKTGTAK